MSRGTAFGLWVLAGVLWALSFAGLLTIGPFVLPFAILATVAGARWGIRQWPGVLVGLGLLVGWLAWLNRFGPGDHCWSTATESGCTEMWSPWPFVAVALVLVLLGVGLGRRGGPGPLGAPDAG